VAVWWILDAVHKAIGERAGPEAVMLLPGAPQVPAGTR